MANQTTKKWAVMGLTGLAVAALAATFFVNSGAVTDVVPFGSPNNVTGTLTTSGGNTSFAADQLASPFDGTVTHYSALYNSPFSTRWFVITFGTDSSLATAVGWDNVTGVGTPNAEAFVKALAP